MNEDRAGNLEDLQRRLPLRCRDESLLRCALQHPSYVNENNHSGVLVDNERLEFLGDAVLGLVVAGHLCQHYGDFTVGELTQLKALLVNEENLSRLARKLDLGAYVLLGRGEKQSRTGRDRPGLLGDALEAVIGAIYLDSGFEGAQKFVLYFMADQIQTCALRKKFCDYKSLLQQESYRRFGTSPVYKVVSTFGPEHRRGYEVAVQIGQGLTGEGIALSKKRAEQLAARHVLRVMSQETEGTSAD